jgi:hypothetical protein
MAISEVHRQQRNAHGESAEGQEPIEKTPACIRLALHWGGEALLVSKRISGLAHPRWRPYIGSIMKNTQEQAAAVEFRRMVKWIVVAGVLMVIGALLYIRAMDAWSFHAVIATILGVFVSVLLGCGLFALAFFSDKSGHDESVAKTKPRSDD